MRVDPMKNRDITVVGERREEGCMCVHVCRCTCVRVWVDVCVHTCMCMYASESQISIFRSRKIDRLCLPLKN